MIIYGVRGTHYLTLLHTSYADNKILENENKELQKQIDNDDQKSKTTLLFKIILGIILGIIFTGIYSIINFIFGSFKKMITQ